MRLKKEDIAGIVEAFEIFFKRYDLSLKKGQLYLYGSRVDDSKKGGDIDLLLVVPKNIRGQVQQKAYQILTLIHEKIGEQKVDILIADQNSRNKDPFFKVISDHMLLLKEWQA